MLVTYPNKSDPPLTERGIQQARATGDFLKKYLEDGHHFDKVIIECSPFLRCMMTAGHIAEKLDAREVIINYRATK